MLTTDPNHPDLNQPGPDGQNKAYLVLPEEERHKGFVRPFRRTYIHTGNKPTFPTRELTAAEKERYAAFQYVLFEMYPEEKAPLTGRYWTQADLNGGCNTQTHMGASLSETYARDPKFYGATFCCNCGKHFPVAEFRWLDGEVVGS